jgi:hypothetical protein
MFSLIFFFAFFGKSYGQDLQFTITNVSCNGLNNGAIQVNLIYQLNCGPGPYQFQIVGPSPSSVTVSSPIISSSNYTFSNLAAGNYVINVLVSGSVCYSTTQTITEPDPINISLNCIYPLCYGATGAIDIIVSGGTPLYDYSWSGPNGFTSSLPDLIGLAPGTYCVTVTDMNGCSDSACCQIIEHPILTSTLTQTNPLCHDDANGSITVTVNGGTPGYTIYIDGGAPVIIPLGQNSHTFLDLAAGFYGITVTCAMGCVLSNSIVLMNPQAITLNATTTPVNCFGGNDGTIFFTASGGTGALSYSTVPASSSGTVVAGNNTISNLSAGIYTLIITDQNGCPESITVVVYQPEPIYLTGITYQILCCGSSGSIDITTGGGTPLYNYLWTGYFGMTPLTISPNNIQDIYGLSPGTYTLTVTDATGCSVTESWVINPCIPPPVITETHTNLTCYNEADGSITVTVYGGTPGYIIYGIGSPVIIPPGQNSHTFSNLAEGSYTIGVIDANATSCDQNTSVLIMNPLDVTLSASTTPVSCNDGNDGTIIFNASGGTGTLSYSTVPESSSGPVVAGNNTISNLSAGIYTLIITDQNGCQESITVVVLQPTQLSIDGIPSQVICYDNNGNGGAIDITVGGGTPGYTYLWTGPVITPSNQDQSELTPGIYCVTVTDANGCSDSTCWQINPSPPLLTITETHTNLICYNEADGSITISVNGGTPGYTITGIGAPVLIATGPNSHTFSNLAEGTYVITITDAYGCSVSLESIDIMAPQPLTLTGVVSGNDIDVTASGGTPNYVYSWSNGSELEDQQNLISGIYILIVTDMNGCVVSDTFDVDNASLYENSNESLLLFPNPSAEFLNIHISPSMENNRFVVFDCLGRTVVSGILESKETIVSVKHLANGIYQLHIWDKTVSFVVAH